MNSPPDFLMASAFRVLFALLLLAASISLAFFAWRNRLHPEGWGWVLGVCSLLPLVGIVYMVRWVPVAWLGGTALLLFMVLCVAVRLAPVLRRL